VRRRYGTGPDGCQDPRMWESIGDPRGFERTAAVESEDATPGFERSRGWWKPARWLAAMLLLLAGIAGIIISGWTVCEERVATVGGQAVVRVCRPPALTDLPVVTGLLVALLLLLPDLAEIGIPGFISLKRRVDDQEAKLAGLEVQVDQSAELRQTAVQSVDSTANAVNLNYIDMNSVLHEFRNKNGGNASLDSHAVLGLHVAPQRGQLEAQLLRAWARLQPLVDLSEHALYDEKRIRDAEFRVEWAEQLYRMSQQDRQHALQDMQSKNLAVAERGRGDFARSDSQTLDAAERLRRARTHLETVITKSTPKAGPAGVQLTNEQFAALRKWRIDFMQEVSIVEAAQRAVAQAEPIDDEKLVAAVTLAEGLLAAWELRQAAIPEADHDRQAADGQQRPKA
jgi:hypothetical protein